MSTTATVIVANHLVQRGIVTKLKADTALIAWLTARSAQSEIREDQWQGRNFVYPAVRVDLQPQEPVGNPPCMSDVGINIYCFSESDNSEQADVLAGLVNDALARKNFSGTGYRSGIVRPVSLVPAERMAERIWRSMVQFTAMLQKGAV